MKRGRKLTQAEVKALKPDDKVWFYYRKGYGEHASVRINEVAEVVEVDLKSENIVLGPGDFSFNCFHPTDDSRPAFDDGCGTGESYLFEVLPG